MTFLEGDALNYERIKHEIMIRCGNSKSNVGPYTRVIIGVGKIKRDLCLSIDKNKDIIYNVNDDEPFLLEEKKGKKVTAVTSIKFVYAAIAA